MPSNSSQSTVLQRVPSAKEAKEGCIQLKPLKVVPTNTEETNEDEFLALPKDATVTLSVAGQTRSSSLPAAAPVLVAAPLSHLYHSQLNVQVEFANKVTYRGSISVDELPIHQTSVVSIDLSHNALGAEGGAFIGEVRVPISEFFFMIQNVVFPFSEGTASLACE